MTKKQTEVLDAAFAPVTVAVPQEATVEQSDRWTRETSVNLALTHHKINGGMLTVAQLIDNAKQFHAYITGE
jgi:hypothetical protein